MAEFGVRATELAGPQAAGSAPVGGFNAPQIRTDVFQGLENKGAMIAGAVQAGASLFGENSGNKILASLTKNLSTLATAKETGKIGRSEADSRTRLIAADALRMANGDPDLVKAIKANVETFTGIAGLSTEEDPNIKFQRELDQATIKGLKDMGFPVIANPTPELMKAYSDTYATIKSSAADAESQAKSIQLAHAKFNYEQDVIKNSAANATNGLISKNLPRFTDTLMKTAFALREQIKKGEITPDAAMQQLSAQTELYRGQLQALSPTSKEFVSSTMSYLDSYQKTLSVALDPKTEESALQSMYNTSVLRDKLFLQTFGNIRAYTALQPLVANNPLMFQQLNDTVMSAATRLSNSFDSNVTPYVQTASMDPADRKRTFKFGQDAIKAAMSTIQDEQSGEGKLGVETVNNIVNNLLAGSANVSPKDKVSTSKEFVDFLASNEFKVWRQKGQLNSEAISAAQSMFDTQYLRGVQQPIINKLDTEIPGYSALASRGYAKNRGEKFTYKDALNVDFKNGMVVFSSKNLPGADVTQMSQGRVFADDVKQLEGVVNTLVRAGANLKGVSVDEYWNQNKSNILPTYFPPNMPNLKVGDVVDGYEYVGGAVKSKTSWKKVENAGQSTTQ